MHGGTITDPPRLETRCLGGTGDHTMVDGRSRNLVFVFDDEDIIASTLAIVLNSSGFEAASFTSPLDALHAASVQGPDLLISDVVNLWGIRARSGS
jgi:PleD family two-component response regulator